MPAHWLKIKPVKMGDKNSFLFITVLTRIGEMAKFIGLSSMNEPLINNKPTFKLPGFNPTVDFINTNLSIQLFNKGMTLKDFLKNINSFIVKHAATKIRHREFVKVSYDHSIANGCDKSVKGISIALDKD